MSGMVAKDPLALLIVGWSFCELSFFFFFFYTDAIIFYQTGIWEEAG